MANDERGPAEPGEKLEQLARRYWDAWQAALQRTMPGAAPGGVSGFSNSAAARPAEPWRVMFEAWVPASPTGNAGIEDVLRGFNRQAGDWWTRMRDVAAGFAGQRPSPETVARTWREALGGDAANPFAQMFGGLGGTGIEGWDGWLRSLQPVIDALRAEGAADGSWPAFGPSREHQVRWQALLEAFAEYPKTQQAYQGLLLQASQAAFARFERRLSDLDAEAVTIESPRALFDLWVEAAEEAYAEVALSPEFRTAYAQMVAGQMRLRQTMQREVEQACRLLDLPTRSELDGAHRKIVDLERTVRRLRDRLEDVESARAEPPRTAHAARAASLRRAARPVRSAAVSDTPAPAATSSQAPATPARPRRAPKKTPTQTAPRQAARTTAGSAQRQVAKRAPAKRAASTKPRSGAVPQAPAPLTSAKSRARKR
ncbi:class III poly(R)-hydroxyalkanoic acid synthase subunit PhaE [Luteimonas sp. S4-F44]|uniref:poly(R)-hydroxyalkanoic acid synthase subunit PhaE n=1 Tax=Luteimonas sp. S4-F44 TaxID=2925842 RepID=UPI001F5338A1|nr:poly(R)-hydroxyalkanoic acid synthase subunit PhaE [Luteimonas sp. S4-F44]UNK41472.1 class III poly(R)-hydroxyalkanoic acid synthase subunit PhaE [Luteimonas sp. S4-F44]